MDSFDHILNWKLKHGSHVFPGRDGGTCLNEAAVVAAGFPYRPVRTVGDMPGCFSRPICHLAMHLNDEASDEERQLLLPFVTRLACADTAEVERRRQAYIDSLMPYRLSFREHLEILEGALAIGRQADPFPSEEVMTRLGAVQQAATMATSVADYAVFSQTKTWFGPFHQD
ncbi:hypothetical protein AA309_13060 [Microvirga vignae]|uniref:Uncharacterized protein n=1 Tax=Microvirga vignae TaxID=1225564 RepID=A0A0H1RD48_9HYPH|nr:hypothetical protein [Microvirga vignae]KLK92776.1 hypothetical protein AA309_13060 [Microvirga vignae]